MSDWGKFTINPPKKKGWVDCPKCNGSGCNKNRTRICAVCLGEGGHHNDEKRLDDKMLIPIPADKEIFSTKPISKVTTGKKGPKYARAQFDFNKKSGF